MCIARLIFDSRKTFQALQPSKALINYMTALKLHLPTPGGEVDRNCLHWKAPLQDLLRLICKKRPGTLQNYGGNLFLFCVDFLFVYYALGLQIPSKKLLNLLKHSKVPSQPLD